MLARGARRAGLILFLLLPLACGEPGATLPPPSPNPNPAAVAGAPAYAANGSLLASVVLERQPPNLILIVLDAVRADALTDGTDDGQVARMPFLEALANRGVRFTSATAPTPETLPSLRSLLTGMLPSEYGRRHPPGGRPFAHAIPTIPEVLQNGFVFDTAAFGSGSAFPHDPEGGLRGFATKRGGFTLAGLEADVGAWNRARDPRRPFFLLLHVGEAGAPYGPRNRPRPPREQGPPAGGSVAAVDPKLLGPGAEPAEILRQCFLDAETYRGLRARMGNARLQDILHRYQFSGYRAKPRPDVAGDLASAYWGGAQWIDGLLQEAHAKLASMGLLANTLLVVTSAHGEAFGEHGNLGHGLDLYDELLQVPLVMVGPEPFRGGHIIDEQVALLDVLPTFLAWTGMPPVAGITGRSALRVVEGEAWCRPVYSEETLTEANTGENLRRVRFSARTPAWKYILELDLRTGEVREEAYDLLLDAQERDDLTFGTGRLSGDQILDDCMCTAVERLRSRVWTDPLAEAEAEVPATRHTIEAPRVPSARPPPCQDGS